MGPSPPEDPQSVSETEDELVQLDIKINQLKQEYEQYFLGSRPREPVLLRGDVQKTMAFLSNQPLQNTALRFKYGSLCSRYQALRRQWDETLRKIEAGTYQRHVFKANLKDRERNEAADRRGAAAQNRDAMDDRADVFDAYISAREATGQGAKGVTREKLDALLAKQESAIRAKYGAKKVRFKVVVEDGKAKVKARKVSAA